MVALILAASLLPEIIMIKVGLSSTSIYPAPVAETFAYARDFGYDGVEIMVSHAKVSQSPAMLRKLADRYDQPVLSIHAPTLILTPFAGGASPETKLRRSAQLAAAIDCPTVVVHPPFRWQGSYAANFLDTVTRISEQTGVKIAVENMFPWRIKGRSMYNYAPSWETITEGAQDLTIDFSHAALAGRDALSMIKENYDKLSHIHLCDGSGVQKLNGKNQVMDEHMLPGKGGQRVAQALRWLNKRNWDGAVVAEINTMKMKSEARAGALDYTIKFARQALSGV